MIFKLQRPISSNISNPACLMYNEDRSIKFEVHIDDMDSLFGDEFKIYVDADVAGHQFEIKEQVEDQDW